MQIRFIAMQRRAGVMQRGNTARVKRLPSLFGHVVARIRPLKGLRMPSGQRSHGVSPGIFKDLQ
jgi:hypothetical protein